jgi:hypothetical protein
MSFKATTKDIQATEEASQGTLPFCGQLWPVWILILTPNPDPDPLTYLNPDPKHWSQLVATQNAEIQVQLCLQFSHISVLFSSPIKVLIWKNCSLMSDRYPDISQVHISMQERNYTMDLRPVMNPTPSTVVHSTPLPQVSCPEYSSSIGNFVASPQ